MVFSDLFTYFSENVSVMLLSPVAHCGYDELKMLNFETKCRDLLDMFNFHQVDFVA